MAKTKSKYNTKHSTNQTIIEQSLGMINRYGMVHFRIDVLANSLSLSPGNITYHYAKREDIAHAIWDEFIHKLKGSVVRLPSLLDVKQLFLLIKGMCKLMYDYRGVVMYMGGDVCLTEHKQQMTGQYIKLCSDFVATSMQLLGQNQYMNIDEQTYSQTALNNRTIILCWWLGSHIVEQCIVKRAKRNNLEKAALWVLFSFYGDLTQKGKDEFHQIEKYIYKQK